MQLSDHPHWHALQRIYHTLVSHGYKAYLAGGCVRDFLLGRAANDLDLATDATPDTIEKLFAKTVAVGKAFGVMIVVEDGISFEVATFRSDGSYANGRHPESVVFTTAEEDAERRDFTVNALFYDLHEGRVLDFVGGVKDLEEKCLKAVGNPDARFKEDHLRLFRAIRFSAQLDFKLEPKTFSAVKDLSSLVKTVSPERIHEETYKLLKSRRPLTGLELLEETTMGKVLFPGWSSVFAKGIKQFESLFTSPLENIFTGEVGAEDALWVSFLAPWALQKEIGWTRILEQYRFSRNLNKILQKALERLENSAHFFMASRGEQLALLSDPGIQLFLSVCARLQMQSRIVEELRIQWHSWGKALPVAMVRADDIKYLVQGRSMGTLLHAAYELQLEDPSLSKDELLAQALKILKI